MRQTDMEFLDPEAEALAGLLASFFEESIIGMCLIESGKQRRVCFANDYMQRIVGGSFKQGMAFAEAWPQSPNFVLPLLDEVQQSQRPKRVEGVTLLGDHAESDAMSQRYFAVTVQPWKQRDGTMRGVLLIAREDTESVHSRLRLEQERETQTAMFRMLSHDLRNPIGSAKMAADGICRAKDVPEKIANKAKRASQALRRADQMISRFLDLRVLHAGQRLPLQRSETELAEAVEPLVEEMNLAFAGRVQLTIEERAFGLWDPQYISRALGNLVENAAKYGDTETAIRVRLAREEGHVCLEVRNQGATLTEEDIASMMSSKPWRREPGHSSHAGGWGMGLALVRSVTEAHQGHLRIVSHDNQTHMAMRFPVPQTGSDAK